jgi:UDP-perosamine 4-acetyltransferase
MTSSRSVIVIGAGGHARVVADAMLCAGVNVLGFTDADAALWGRTLLGLPVLGGDEVLDHHSPRDVLLANGVGSIDNRAPSLRQRIQERLRAAGWRFASVVHPKAILSPRAVLGEGVQLLAGSIVQCGAELGEGVIVNTGSIVEHDVRIGGWSHLAPGAILCGDVRLGRSCHVGAGATVRQGLTIGDGCLIGIGAAAVKDAPPAAVLIGVPARPINSK